jgi:hypothetical protein
MQGNKSRQTRLFPRPLLDDASAYMYICIFDEFVEDADAARQLQVLGHCRHELRFKMQRRTTKVGKQGSAADHSMMPVHTCTKEKSQLVHGLSNLACNRGHVA